jgi:SAM-dependent methyltransferase
MLVAVAVPTFSAERLHLVAELEHSHFWFTGRRELVQRLLDRHVCERVGSAVDVGCGTGSFLDVLALYAERIRGLDRLVWPDDPRIVAGSAERMPLETGSVDLIVALDVLEHVDDREALRECARVLRDDGVLVLTVPAFPSLWSSRDQLAGHRRRYRKAELTRQLKDSGFEVAETTYYQFVLFPFLAASRFIGRLRPDTTELEERLPSWLNGPLRRLNALEVRLGSRVHWPWGSTLAIAARKKDA